MDRNEAELRAEEAMFQAGVKEGRRQAALAIKQFCYNNDLLLNKLGDRLAEIAERAHYDET